MDKELVRGDAAAGEAAARKSRSASAEHARNIHTNYCHMLRRLNTSTYELASPEYKGYRPFGGYDNLPSYTTLVKIATQDTPQCSVRVARKLVDFHNANLKPSISLDDFLSKDLSDVAFQSRNEESSLIVDPSFFRTYMGFYWGTEAKGVVRSAMIRFYPEDAPDQKWSEEDLMNPGTYQNISPQRLRAVMIFGLRNFDHDSLNDCNALMKNIINGQPFDKVKVDGNRWFVYRGQMEITADTVTAVMSRPENSAQKCVFSMDVALFRKSERAKSYIGGCGILFQTHNQRVMKLCLADKELFCGLIEGSDPRLKQHLSPPFDPEEPIRLGRDDELWYGYLTELLDHGKLR